VGKKTYLRGTPSCRLEVRVASLFRRLLPSVDPVVLLLLRLGVVGDISACLALLWGDLSAPRKGAWATLTLDRRFLSLGVVLVAGAEYGTSVCTVNCGSGGVDWRWEGAKRPEEKKAEYVDMVVVEMQLLAGDQATRWKTNRVPCCEIGNR
jgi:hypothetical protein